MPALSPLSCPDNPSPRHSPARGEGDGGASVMPAGPLCHASWYSFVIPAGAPLLSFTPVVSGNPVSFFVPLFVWPAWENHGFPIKNVGNDRRGITNVGHDSGRINNVGYDSGGLTTSGMTEGDEFLGRGGRKGEKCRGMQRNADCGHLALFGQADVASEVDVRGVSRRRRWRGRSPR